MKLHFYCRYADTKSRQLRCLARATGPARVKTFPRLAFASSTVRLFNGTGVVWVIAINPTKTDWRKGMRLFAERPEVPEEKSTHRRLPSPITSLSLLATQTLGRLSCCRCWQKRDRETRAHKRPCGRETAFFYIGFYFFGHMLEYCWPTVMLEEDVYFYLIGARLECASVTPSRRPSSPVSIMAFEKRHVKRSWNHSFSRDCVMQSAEILKTGCLPQEAVWSFEILNWLNKLFNGQLIAVLMWSTSFTCESYESAEFFWPSWSTVSW